MSHFRQQIYSSKNITVSGEVIADAGADQSSSTLSGITLSTANPPTGTTSTLGAVDSWLWTQDSGPAVVITTPTTETTTISGSDIVGEYVFTVRVGDDQGNFDTDSVNITITATIPLSVSSTPADANGDGDLVFANGEAGEVLTLESELFQATIPDAVTFTGTILNGDLNYSSPKTIGSVTLDGSGGATEQYDASGDGTFTCQVKITGRDIGSMPLTYGTTAILVTLP